MTASELERGYRKIDLLNSIIDTRARLAARALLDGEPEAARRFAERMAETEKVRDRLATQLHGDVVAEAITPYLLDAS